MDTTPKAATLPLSATVRWCTPCNARDRLHFDGRCVMAHTHPEDKR